MSSPRRVSRAGAARLDDEVDEATPDHTKQRPTPATKQRTTSTTQKKSAVDVDYIKQQQSKMRWRLAAKITAMALLTLGCFMMAVFEVRTDWVGHLAFGLTFVAFTLKDIMWLRVLAIMSNLLVMAYAYWHPYGNILWVPMLWNGAYALINSTRVLLLLKERAVFMSLEQRLIFHTHFIDSMEIHDFGKLIKLATFVQASERHELIHGGLPPQQLILLTAGEAEVDVGDGVFIKHGPGVLGESAFLRKGTKASASVFALPGCEYYSWDLEQIAAIKKKAKAASRGLELSIGRGLVEKLSTTTELLRDNTSQRLELSRRNSDLQNQWQGLLKLQKEHAQKEEEGGSNGAASGDHDAADPAPSAASVEVEMVEVEEQAPRGGSAV